MSAVGVQQRLDAALRLEPLEGGRRDPTIPWTTEAPAAGELVIDIDPDVRYSAWLQGDSRRVVPLLDRVGCGRQWDADAGAWMFPRSRVDDVLAMADTRPRRHIRLRLVNR